MIDDDDVWLAGVEAARRKLAALGPFPVSVDLPTSAAAELARRLPPAWTHQSRLVAHLHDTRLPHLLGPGALSLRIDVDDDLPHRPEPVMRVHYSDGTSKVVTLAAEEDR